MVEKLTKWIKENKIFTATLILVLCLLILNMVCNYTWILKKEERIAMSVLRLFDGKHDVEGTFELKTSKESQGETDEELILWIALNSLEIVGDFNVGSESKEIAINGSVTASDEEITPIDFNFKLPDKKELKDKGEKLFNLDGIKAVLSEADKGRVKKNIVVGKISTPYYLDCYEIKMNVTDFSSLMNEDIRKEWEKGMKLLESSKSGDVLQVPVSIAIYIDKDCYMRGIEIKTENQDLGVIGEIIVTNIE